jgi:hypothetical protein
MCVYCERRQDVKHGWEQPALYGKEYPEDSTGGKIHSNLNVDGEPDWEAHIYDYQTKTPELVLTSKRFAEDIWGDGVASIHVPIRFCPVCGRKLGEKQKEKGTKKYCIYNGKL